MRRDITAAAHTTDAIPENASNVEIQIPRYHSDALQHPTVKKFAIHEADLV